MNNRLKTTLALAALTAIGQTHADSSDVIVKNKEQISTIPAQQAIPVRTDENSNKQTPENIKHTNFFDDMFDEFEHSMQRMREWQTALAESYNTFEASFAKAEKRASIATTAEITEDEKNVYLTLTVGDETVTLDPKSVDLTTKENQIHGTIQIPHGKITFVLTPNGLFITKNTEIKNETAQDEKTTHAFVNYSSSSFSRNLPATVDLAAIKAEVEKNTLMVTLGKKLYAKIPVTAANSK